MSPVKSENGTRFINSMNFHHPFHDLSEFSMTYVKQLFSNYYQNILGIPHIMTHKKHANVFLLELNGFLTCLLFLRTLDYHGTLVLENFRQSPAIVLLPC